MIKQIINNILSKLFPYKGIDTPIHIQNWDRLQVKAIEDYWGGSPGRGYNFDHTPINIENDK